MVSWARLIITFASALFLTQTNAQTDTQTGLVPLASAVSSEGRGCTSGNMQNGGFAVASGEWIYYVSEGSLYRTREGSNESEIISEDINSLLPRDPFRGNLNIWDDWLFFTTMHGSIYRMPAAGGTPEVVLEGETQPMMQGVCEFLIADGWMYYNYETSTPDTLNRSSIICRVSLDGTKHEIVIGEDGTSMYWLLDVAGGYIYYTGIRHEDDTFYNYRIPVGGGQPERLDFMPYAAQIQVADDWIYYCDSSGSQNVRRIHTDGSDEQILYDEERCNDINVSGDWIYCLITPDGDKFDERFYIRIKKDGSDMQMLYDGELMRGTVAGDIICSQINGTMRIHDNGPEPYLEQIGK